MATKTPNNDLYNFLRKIHEGQTLGFYQKQSMRFDEVYKAGIQYLQMQGVEISPEDPLQIAALPPERKARK